MRHRNTLLSLIAIFSAAGMLRFPLSVWLLAFFAATAKIWVLFAGGILLSLFVFALVPFLPRLLSRR